MASVCTMLARRTGNANGWPSAEFALQLYKEVPPTRRRSRTNARLTKATRRSEDNNKGCTMNNVNLAHSELLELKNLGMASVHILQAIGINTYEDLAEMGPVQAYCRIKARGIHVSKV